MEEASRVSSLVEVQYSKAVSHPNLTSPCGIMASLQPKNRWVLPYSTLVDTYLPIAVLFFRLLGLSMTHMICHLLSIC